MTKLIGGGGGRGERGGVELFFFGGGDQRQGYWGHLLLKTPKIALVSEYLAADLSADASADALCIINIG